MINFRKERCGGQGLNTRDRVSLYQGCLERGDADRQARTHARRRLLVEQVALCYGQAKVLFRTTVAGFMRRGKGHNR